MEFVFYVQIGRDVIGRRIWIHEMNEPFKLRQTRSAIVK
jgi:hypothetical protein